MAHVLYLKGRIAAGELNEKEFTVNNHYLCHLKGLIEDMGPMRAYSCRSIERTIKVFTNLITATTKVAVNSSNIFRRYHHYHRHAIQRIQQAHFPESPINPNSYRVHPQAGDGDHGELWESFGQHNLMQSRPNELLIFFGLKRTKVINALRNYYSRVRGRILPITYINCGTVEMAAAVEENGIVHGSVMERKKKHLSTRGNDVVLFKATRKVGQG